MIGNALDWNNQRVTGTKTVTAKKLFLTTEYNPDKLPYPSHS